MTTSAPAGSSPAARRLDRLARVVGLPRPDLDRFAGATVVVTGASSGIGAELARCAARTAGTVVLVARRRERLEALTAGPRAAGGPVAIDIRTADLSTREGVEGLGAALLAEHEVGVLLNNAGFGDYGLLEEADPDTLARMIAVNVTAPTLLTRAVLPSMVARGGGAVMVVGSSAGQLATPGAAVYAATKYYVHGLCTALQGELAGTGVTLTEVAPGPVATEFDEVSGMGPLTHSAEALRIDPEQCARKAWEGLCGGRPIVYHGAGVRVSMAARGVAPDVLMRPAMQAMGRRLRRQGSR